MKQKALIMILFLFMMTNGMGQTKKIFHKSHSGSPGTMLLDDKNNFGPGMAPVRYQTPESRIQLSYLSLEGSSHRYPKVLLDTVNKTMRFFDTKDSLIGCDRNYREYLQHGSLVFDVLTQEFWVYQNYSLVSEVRQVAAQRFFIISDSVKHWQEDKRWIRSSNSFIRDGNNHRILMTYPMLEYTKTSQLKPELVNPRISYPILKGEKVVEEEKKARKKAKSSIREERKKSVDNKKAEKEERIAVPMGNKIPPMGTWLIWMGIFFFGFSAFIFLGIKQIVKEEVTKMKYKK